MQFTGFERSKYYDAQMQWLFGEGSQPVRFAHSYVPAIGFGFLPNENFDICTV